MFYTDEMANYILNYSKTLVEQAGRVKSYPKELKEIQYLIFAGMISYYGFEHINEIYNAFIKTNFVYSDEPILDILRKKSEIYKGSVNKLYICEATKAFLEHKFLTNRAGKFFINRTIYLSDDKKCPLDTFLEYAIHEVNHVVNSVTNDICKRDGNVVFRMGLYVSGLRGTNVEEGLIFEESVNVLQSVEILDEILRFGDYNIEDDDIRRVIDKLKVASENRYRKSSGYEHTVPIVRPLYESPTFKSMVKEKRLDGSIKEIREAFDLKTRPGAFYELTGALDTIGVGKTAPLVMYTAMNNAENIVKQYVKN